MLTKTFRIVHKYVPYLKKKIVSREKYFIVVQKLKFLSIDVIIFFWNGAP